VKLRFYVPEGPEGWQHWRKFVVFGGVHVAASVAHPHVISGVSQQIGYVKHTCLLLLSTHQNNVDCGSDCAKYNLTFVLRPFCKTLMVSALKPFKP
jgi:hypothetical protein